MGGVDFFPVSWIYTDGGSEVSEFLREMRFRTPPIRRPPKTQHLSVRMFFLWFKARLQMQPYAMLRAQGWTHCSASLPPIFQLLFTVDGDGWGWMGMDGDGWGWMGIVTQISVNEQLYFVHICSDTGMC